MGRYDSLFEPLQVGPITLPNRIVRSPHGTGLSGEALIAYDLNATRLLAARPQDDLLHSMTDRSWKLIYRPRRPELSELYHLDSDPAEQFNRYESDPGEARRLLAAIEALDPFVDTPFGEGQDEEIRERLRSLGYVGTLRDGSPGP